MTASEMADRWTDEELIGQEINTVEFGDWPGEMGIFEYEEVSFVHTTGAAALLKALRHVTKEKQLSE